MGKTRGQHWLASTHKPRQDFSTTNSFGEGGTKKNIGHLLFTIPRRIRGEVAVKVGRKKTQGLASNPACRQISKTFFQPFFFFKTQPKSLGTTSFQSCKKVVARGRAAGLWINVSIKEASPAPDFRACWTIFGCRNCHIIWLWHRVSATEPLCGNMFLPQPRCCGNKRSVLGKKRCHRNGLWHFFATASPMWHNLLLEARRVATLFCHRSCRWQLGFRGG